MKKKSFFAAFAALCVMILSAITLTGCSPDDEFNMSGNLNGNGEPTPDPDSEWYLDDVWKNQCVFVRDSTHTNTPNDSESSIAMSGLKYFELTIGGTLADRNELASVRDTGFVRGYNVNLAATVANYKVVLKDEGQNLPDSVEMKDGKFTVCNSEMPVTILPVEDVSLTVNGGPDGQTEFVFGTDKADDFKLESSEITRGYILFGKKGALQTRAVVEETTIPAEIHFVCKDGLDLIYGYTAVIATSLEERDEITAEFVDITDDGYVKYEITRTHLPDGTVNRYPGMIPVNAELTAAAIENQISENPGINLTSAREREYADAGDYNFVYNKFNSTVNASYINSVTVEFEGNPYQIEIPGGVWVTQAGISQPVIDTKSNDDYTLYTYTLNYNLTWKYNEIARPFKYAETTFTELVEKENDEIADTQLILTENGNNTVKLELVEYHTVNPDVTLGTWVVPAGLRLSCTPEFTIEDANLALSGGDISALTSWTANGSEQVTDNVTATRISRTYSATFNHGTDREIEFSQYETFTVSYENRTYSASVDRAALERPNIELTREVETTELSQKIWTVTYTAQTAVNEVDATQIWTITQNKTEDTGNIELTAQESANNTVTLTLTEYHTTGENTVLGTWVVPNGLTLTCTPEFSRENADQSLTGGDLSTVSDWRESTTERITDNVKATRIHKTYSAAFNQGTDRNISLSQYETYIVTYNNVDYSASVSRAEMNQTEISLSRESDTSERSETIWNVVYSAHTVSNSTNASQIWTIYQNKEQDEVEKIELSIQENGNNTVTLNLTEYHTLNNDVLLVSQTVPAGLSVSCTPEFNIENDNTSLTGGSVSTVSDWSSQGTRNLGNNVTATQIAKTFSAAFNHGTDRNITVSQYERFTLTYQNTEYSASVIRATLDNAVIGQPSIVDNAQMTQRSYPVSYTAKTARNSASGNQTWVITSEKPDNIVDYLVGSEVITLEGNQYFRNVSVTPVYSVSGNGRPYTAKINTQFTVSDNGTIVVTGEMGNLSLTRETTSNISAIRNDSVTGNRTRTTSVYAIGGQNPILYTEIDGVAALHGKQLMTLVPATSAVIENTGETYQDGLYTVTVYNIVYTITVDGKSVNHTQRLENRVLNAEPTIPGLEVDPDRIGSFARTEVYNNARSIKSQIDAGIFREIDNPSVKHFVAFDVASGAVLVNTVVSASELSVLDSKNGYCSLLKLDNQQPAVLYGNLSGNNYKQGFEYKALASGELNTFSDASITLERYSNPLINTLVSRGGYYQMGSDTIYK